jgi:hypothetical protein
MQWSFPSLLILLLFPPSVVVAGGTDYQLSLVELSSSFVESSGSATVRASVSRERVRVRGVLRKRRKRNPVFIRLNLPEGTSFTSLPKRCREVASEESGVRVEC